MFKSGILLFAVILLAGCAENSVNRLPPSESPGTNVVHEVYALPNPPPPARPIPPVRAPYPSPPVSVPTTTWASLTDWAAEHKITAPLRRSDMPVAAYSIASKYGTMILEIGSREATWNGVQISLGFAPQLIDGEISLYGLDLQKNIEPLLCEPPMAFTPHRVIVIDPGHGGSNVGTHSVLDGRFEKEFTLDWAKRLKPLLEAEGWKVYLTRDSDVFVTNSDRVVFANERQADIFISLHFNSAAPDTAQAGIETYCLPPVGTPSTISRSNYTDPWTQNYPNNAFDAQNLRLAVRVHTALLHAMGMPDRGVRRARFITVLQGQLRPSILIEAGYLSNPDEASLIESGSYRQKLAAALAGALRPLSEGGR
ncbi:MAG TPA: N-acetylmuramoyl-L-alanine amidase [Verrucomicrobiae bacterium]|nr:N-acetylmuramoyl-L-alanine amidase [Verrucomicrobiae bacterium]